MLNKVFLGTMLVILKYLVYSKTKYVGISNNHKLILIQMGETKNAVVFYFPFKDMQ